MPRIAWSPTSLRHLAEIRDYIATSAPGVAGPYVRKLKLSVVRLRHAPLLGETLLACGRTDLREILFGNYRIIYRVTGPFVEILAVMHGARLINPDTLGT